MKILIIKLGAMGDVIRTLPVVKAIKEHNKNAEIVWITKKESLEILENIAFINKVLSPPIETNEEFDILYNFDIEEDATKLASKIKAKKKFGFFEEEGFVKAFNLGAEYYLNTIFDDEMKRENKKTYQEMMFETAELEYKKEIVEIKIPEKYKEYALNFIKNNNLDQNKLIGIHTGSSPRWPSKVWSEKKLIEFIEEAKSEGYEIILFGGVNEIERNKEISEELKKKNIQLYQNNPNNSSMEFASLVSLCKIIICSDSFALHISLALKKRTISLFFCTSPDEVESYGLLKKMVSPLLYEYFPERMNEYNEKLVNSISVESVLEELNKAYDSL